MSLLLPLLRGRDEPDDVLEGEPADEDGLGHSEDDVLLILPLLALEGFILKLLDFGVLFCAKSLTLWIKQWGASHHLYHLYPGPVLPPRTDGSSLIKSNLLFLVAAWLNKQ